jgi:hypothetical protein
MAPSVPFITLAGVNATNAAAVAAANPCRKLACPLVPTVDVSEPVSSTLPANVAVFPAPNIMPTAFLVPTAKFARPEAVAADVFVATAAAYSTLGVTIVDDDAKMWVKTVKAFYITANLATAEAAAIDVTVATAASANLATAEAAATDVLVTILALSSASAAAIDLAARAVAAPVVASVGKEGLSFA